MISVGETDVVLVRHGETEWSKAGQHTGRTDIALTELGRRQADQLSTVLPQQFATVLTSPLIRARETAVRAGFDDQAINEPNLMEWDYGAVEGRTTEDIRIDHPGWAIFRDGPTEGGETIEEVGARLDLVIARLLESPGPALVFAHGHSLRVLAARWIELPAVEGQRLRLETATVSVVGFERETRVIHRWNDDTHL